MRGLVLAALAVSAAVAQPVDSLAVPVAEVSVAEIPLIPDTTRTPRGAVTRALLAPGLGQLYNRQPVKAPIATALVVGAAVLAVTRQRTYLRYRRATVFAGCAQDVIPDDREFFAEVCANDAPDYEDEWQALGSASFQQLRPIRDRARGQRDVGVLVVALAYAVQALDAYVAAELAGFDVSEDVAVRMEAGPTPTLRLSIGL